MRICDIKDCNEKHYTKGLCYKHYNQQYRQENKERIDEVTKQWFKDNPKYRKQYRQDNKKHISKYSKQWEKDNKEHVSKWHKTRYLNNKEHIIEVNKQWRKDNKEYHKKYMKLWQKTPSGKASMKAHFHNRRILEKGLTLEIIQQIYEDNIAKYGVLTCILCNKPIESGKDSLEHLTPLSRGGTNNYENLGVAHYICNCQKQAKTLEEWNQRKLKKILEAK